MPTSAPLNTAGLRVDSIAAAISPMSVRFATPELGNGDLGAAPNSFEVRLLVDAPEADALGIDVALDDQRPRRLPSTRPATTLGQLMQVDGTLSPGEHWLFAAPVLASGVVPRRRADAPPSAVARRFFVANLPDGAPGAARYGGAVWLRRPEGTYNGPSSQRLLFDLFSFDATGAALATPCTVVIDALGAGGKLRLATPFALLDVPSGEYRVTVSAPAARPATYVFTVNHELGGGP